MSKKFCLTLFLVIALSAMTFGFEKGTKSIGGIVAIESDSFEFGSYDYGYESIVVYPMLSYFAVKNVCLDISPGFGISWAKDRDTWVSTSLGLGFRYFYKRFYAGALYDYRKSGPKDRKVASQHLTLRAGHLMGIAKNIYLDFGLIYRMGLGEFQDWYENVDNDSRQFTARVGVQLFFK